MPYRSQSLPEKRAESRRNPAQNLGNGSPRPVPGRRGAPRRLDGGRAGASGPAGGRGGPSDLSRPRSPPWAAPGTARFVPRGPFLPIRSSRSIPGIWPRRAFRSAAEAPRRHGRPGEPGPDRPARRPAPGPGRWAARRSGAGSVPSRSIVPSRGRSAVAERRSPTRAARLLLPHRRRRPTGPVRARARRHSGGGTTAALRWAWMPSNANTTSAAHTSEKPIRRSCANGSP